MPISFIFIEILVQVLQTNIKQLNTMRNYWVVNNFFIKDSPFVIKDHLVFVVGKRSYRTCGAIRPPCDAKEPQVAESF